MVDSGEETRLVLGSGVESRTSNKNPEEGQSSPPRGDRPRQGNEKKPRKRTAE